MFKRPHILCFFLLSLLLLGQSTMAQSTFSWKTDLFATELTKFMGPNLTPEQTLNLNNFLVKFDSSYFSTETKSRIIDIAGQFQGRSMRAVPNFNNFFTVLNSFVDNNVEEETLTYWLKGLSETAFDPKFSNDFIDRYVKNFGKMVQDNVIFESTSGIRWAVEQSPLQFLHDTTFKVMVEEAQLICFTARDSTIIHNVTGIYYPDLQLFKGTSGVIDFQKAGYGPDEVFAEIKNFDLDVTKNSFTIDSALLTHKVYFPDPVYGILSDQSITYKDKNNASFPRFETYEKSFFLEEIYEGINYSGGLSFEGSKVKGKGDEISLAKITLYRNDTLYIKVASKEFLFSQNRLAGSETSMVLYLDKDSIFHNNLDFSYAPANRQVNMFRANNPISKGPYFDSFHNLDMYFELLSWDMNTSKIVLSKAIGAAQGEAQFESASFFNENYYLRLQGIDEYHPLVRMQRFAEWYYSETFPVEDFAKWLNKPAESVTGLCIDMANKGFVYYDRNLNTVTLKQKVNDYVQSFLKRQDYDVIRLVSQADASTDNAVLNLRNYQLKVNGVKNIALSTAQNVVIKPYGDSLTIGQNRKISFDGVVEAGLFTVYGHNFSFDYDTFKIRLQSIDSIKIAVETDQYDAYGNPLIKDIDNLIQLGTADIFIDEPYNKSGLPEFEQYPIINATTYSYIFYDKIAGLEGVYPQSDFYFRIDPFTYENIDHYTDQDMNLAGEFHAGGIIEPIKQFLTIQEDNSLGFNMDIPENGIALYGNKGTLYNKLSMNNKGLVGSGSMSHLTSTTEAENFYFYPDSMIAQANWFKIGEDGAGLFPNTQAENVAVKWLPNSDEFIAVNDIDKKFDMFQNGTNFDGTLTLTPLALLGSGVTSSADFRITSELFNFTSNSIKADISDYNLMSPSSNNYAFIANNSSTNVNFETGLTKFHLNTDTSMVFFPEIQYLCTMTDFTYNMNVKVMEMGQEGENGFTPLANDKLIAITKEQIEKPTFFSTNMVDDTISFFSSKGRYYVNDEYIVANNINYIPIADALIQPDSGSIVINRRAKIERLENAVVAVNNNHILHSATINIESTKRYNGSGKYDYVDEDKFIQQIDFPEIKVDTLRTSAKGYIAAVDSFMLSPAFGFQGDVDLYSISKELTFTGAASIVHFCDLTSYPVKFKSAIDPKNVMIPVSDKPRDINDNMVFSGSFVNIDSAHIYPAFLSAQKSWTDAGLVTSQGFLWFDKPNGRYLIANKDKIADPTIAGNMVAFERDNCTITGEGALNFGTDFDLVKTAQSGNFTHLIDSVKVTLNAMLAFDFYFSEEALNMMKEELRMMPTLKAVDISNNQYDKALTDLIGRENATAIKTDLSLYGALRSVPKDFGYELLLNDVDLYWDEQNSSFRSVGQIGIGFIGSQPMNVYVDGYVEIQRRRTGDMFDIYLKADNSTWYYFSYMRGNMMTQAGNNNYNILVSTTKLANRKHPDSNTRQPYTYMISVEDRLARFINRMEEEGSGENGQPDGVPTDF